MGNCVALFCLFRPTLCSVHRFLSGTVLLLVTMYHLTCLVRGGTRLAQSGSLTCTHARAPPPPPPPPQTPGYLAEPESKGRLLSLTSGWSMSGTPPWCHGLKMNELEGALRQMH